MTIRASTSLAWGRAPRAARKELEGRVEIYERRRGVGCRNFNAEIVRAICALERSNDAA